MKQHKWHKEIKAWADGATIEWSASGGKTWFEDDERPNWANSSVLFRIKPQPKEKQYLYVFKQCNTDEIDITINDERNSDMVKIGQLQYIGKIKLEVENGN